MSVLLRIVSGICKGIYRSVVFIGSLFFSLLFIAMIAVFALSIFYSEDVTVADNSILKLTLSGTIVEQRTLEDPYINYAELLMGLPEKPRETVLQEVLDTIDYAESDPRIEAILLDLKYLQGAGLNQLEAIGASLASFKKTGKPVISIEDSYSQDQYYLAAHGSKIFINPMGGVNLNGFGMYRFYFKEALEKLKIDFHVFRVGDHKSAIEPLTRNSMSAEDRSQSREWLSALWQNYITDVSAQRGLKPDNINRYINAVPDNLREVNGDLAGLAMKSGLVDGIKNRREIRSYLMEIVDAKSEDEVSIVSFFDYHSQVPAPYDTDGRQSDQIGLIIAEGTIIDGSSQPGTIGAETVMSLLRQAGSDDRIKAVVLRIDSGGGSAFASELIRQEIIALKNDGKPVLVSMGAYAASGGYWISANADEIWASANTLTGSIGIFMAVPTFEKLLESGGIHRDGVGTTNLAAGLDLTRPLSDELGDAIQMVLENGYDRFISIVADGRNMDRKKVEELARGRVYAGARAKELGLIDEIGALDQTIAAAAARAGLSDYGVTHLKQEVSFRSLLLSRLHAAVSALADRYTWLAPVLSAARPLTSAVQRFLLFPDPNGMYAHCMIGYF
jgi:protease-4